MKDKIDKVLQKYFPNFANIQKCRDEIIKVVDFENMCDPDIAEAGINEKIVSGLYSQIAEMQDHIKELEHQISHLR